MRPEGNWLLELGFDRIKPPDELEECASVYSLQLPGQGTVILRGFGVFYGDAIRGVIFMPRYEFQPRFAANAVLLERPPWTPGEIPDLELPTRHQRSTCASLTLELLDWIRSYEVVTNERLGIGYRRDTLQDWDNGTRICVPAEEFAAAWRGLSFRVAADFDAFSRAEQAA